MTVADAVVMGRHPHLSRWAWEGDDEAAHANRALADVGLEALARRDVTTLSGGERQRVAIATLLAQDAPLMLLDEPIAHLDLRYQLRVLDHLAELGRRDRGIVLSIHDLTLARRCATHALLLHGDGRADVGRVEDVMTDDGPLRRVRVPRRARRCQRPDGLRRAMKIARKDAARRGAVAAAARGVAVVAASPRHNSPRRRSPSSTIPAPP